MRRRAVVLLSGGLDSATTLAVAIAEGFEAHALAVDYGQRHRVELDAARRVAEALRAASFRVLKADLASLGGSALTAAIDVPKDRPLEEMSHGIPPTYVPARNTVLLALALAAAEALDADAVFLGVNAVDYSGYPDCRPEFLEAFRRVAALGTKRGVEGRPIDVRAPLLRDSKADIVRRARGLGVPIDLTFSCYDPVKKGDRWVACGRCDACRLREKGLREASPP